MFLETKSPATRISILPRKVKSINTNDTKGDEGNSRSFAYLRVFCGGFFLLCRRQFGSELSTECLDRSQKRIPRKLQARDRTLRRIVMPVTTGVFDANRNVAEIRAVTRMRADAVFNRDSRYRKPADPDIPQRHTQRA